MNQYWEINRKNGYYYGTHQLLTAVLVKGSTHREVSEKMPRAIRAAVRAMVL